ncbi:hypothetical protein M0R04_06645 [Candidatus Dojkabacteria bacterium]|jgi:hypothetical protein|nr:hypothetical protein [Candidatus Dojkabacteria bacterium]
MSKWSKLAPPGTEEEIKARRNEFMKKHSKEVYEKANGKTAMDALKRANPVLAFARVLKGVDDKVVDPVIGGIKGLVRKVTRKK